MRILIIDDQAEAVAEIEQMLTEEGFTEFASTTDPRMAVSLASQFRPDLVLVDLHAPPCDGLAVLKALAALRLEGEFLPMIVLAERRGDAEERSLAAGAADFLPRPFHRPQAILRISALLAIRRRQLELEDTLAERTARLDTALGELRITQQHFLQSERLSALGSMIAGITHDFNNSLALILGSGELLHKECRKKGVAGGLADYAQTIVTAAVDASETVHRLREFLRPAAAMETRPALALSEVVRQAVEMTRPRWAAEALGSGLHIGVRTELDENASVAANAAEFREMLTRLIINAIDAMPQGGTLTLRTRVAGGSVTLEVSDTGLGMTEDVRRRCLDPSFTVKGGRGPGFGLAKIGGTVGRHGGTIAIESVRGCGSKFVLTFPAAHPADTALLTPVEKRGPSLRILIVDDQPAFCDILAETLAGEGHSVERADQGQAALEIFERLECDLVITDKAMPLMNGDQLAAAIKARSPDTPIIMLTGFGDVEDSPEHVSEFIDLALTKPVSHRKLCDSIRAVTAAR